jgi:hypothetical protein
MQQFRWHFTSVSFLKTDGSTVLFNVLTICMQLHIVVAFRKFFVTIFLKIYRQYREYFSKQNLAEK